jgi:DNA-binding NarL/FixJ family response regulator
MMPLSADDEIEPLAGPLTAIVVEDDDEQRRALVEAATRVGLTVELSTGLGADVVRHAQTAAAPMLVLLDLRLADGDGIKVLKELRRSWPKTAFVVVSALTDELTVIDAIRHGARGYLLKDGSLATLTADLRRVVQGHTPISPAVARHLVAQLQLPTPSVEDGPPLSGRELEILRAIAAGLSYKEIADKLAVKRSTVEAHIKNLYRKLASHSKVQAISRGKELGYLS